ncbi:unnamed protein product [Rotaria sordida]|uniref:Major facilitator superfamily (MFS) profile domain-containing protein n=1 Tax=Rotaria sordida TaxID=392033 RepID=A0A814F957_9BILA|nr:unnamed protein product [Rotaria sordida]CAF3772355.1 unnamed protein product [Rotaria sordida]
METSTTYTLEECINHIGLGKYQWRLISILGFCSMADAVEMMLLAILGPAIICYWPDVTKVQMAALTTGVFAGMMIGAFIFGIIADKYGRRRVIIISAVLNTLFGIFTAMAQNYYSILVARILVGFALSGAAQGSTLMLEYLPSSTRATILIVNELFWSIGSIFEYVMGMVIVPSYGWRLLTALSALPITIVAIFMYFVPESPRYFVASGRPEDAEHILKAIASINKRSLPEGKLHDIHAQEECGSIKHLFHSNYKRTSFLLALMWMIVAMSYYGLVLINTSIMTLSDNEHDTITNTSTITPSQCKMLTNKDYQSLIFTTFGEMFGIPLLLLLLAYFGRRIVCAINFSCASFCFLLFLFISQTKLWIINIITFLARMFISSQFSLMYLYTMEAYPTVIRAMAVGCASSMARIGAMITPFLAQVLIKHTFHGTIAIYMIATAMAAVCAILLPIETRGRELKQATSDHRSSSIVPVDVAVPSWVAAVDNIASLVHANDDIVNQGYRPLIQEDISDEEA